MTAEIAVINRGAVTLAADSAMSLQVRGREKIYTSADKLFELCDDNPIGIMVYNTPEFFGVPIEAAIKLFRKQNTTNFKTVKEASDAFFNFLLGDLMPDDSLVKSHVFETATNILRSVRSYFEEKVREMFLRAPSKGHKKKDKSQNPYELFLSTIKHCLSVAERRGKAPGDVGKLADDDLRSAYGDVLLDAIKNVFHGLPIDDNDSVILEKICIHMLRSDNFSDRLTGFVFAGFGSDELFPSLICFETDGILCGHLKRKEGHRIETNRGDGGAWIIPFAQREMADRFLNGVDAEFETGLTDLCSELLHNVGDQIIKESARSKKRIDELHAKLKKAIDEAVNSVRAEWLPKTKNKFKEQVEDMVLFMTKPEMASLAEALVNITSIKRKFSAEAETVAGPIDVAVISKNDGFVWVKRKHYFDPELNPRYFWRKYGLQQR